MDVGALAALTIVLQLILLEGLLSIDNAAVLSAMVAHLPDDQRPPWPKRLRFLSRPLGPVLGMQRDAALKVGLLGAYLGRGLMLVLAGAIIRVPEIRIVGAFYLLYLGINYFADFHQEQERKEAGIDDQSALQKTQRGFWAVVVGVELADLAFSIDNVIAAVALSNEIWAVLLGVAIGILIMRFAATIFVRLIDWEPALEHGAYVLLLSIGVQLLCKEFWGMHIPELVQFSISVAILVLTVLVARSRRLQRAIIVLRPMLLLFVVIQMAISSVIWLVTLPFNARG